MTTTSSGTELSTYTTDGWKANPEVLSHYIGNVQAEREQR